MPWEQVRSHMHVDSGWGHTAPTAEETAARPRRMAAYRATLEEDAELLKIFERTYGPIKRDPLAAFRPVQKRERPDFAAEQWEIAPEYLLVDGYNIIFAWDELNALSKESLDAARHRLMDILCNYQGFKKCVLILVFDAYRVPGSPGSIEQYHNIHVVYTKEAETRTLVKKLLTGFSGSAVLDADGLNAAASLMNAGEELPRPAKELILTPHPGELSRLTGLSVEAVQADREGVARRYAAQWNAVVVLKGARTVVAAPDGRVCVNPTGNPGLARGGSGDVLAGMTSALLACGLSAYEAAACAVWLHGAAADRAARQKGEYGMLPQDIFAHLGQMFAENDR